MDWTATGVAERQDRRYLRALKLAANVMQTIRPLLPDTEEYHRLGTARAISNALLELFNSEGVEVLTDYTRAEIGLPPRDAKGWTMEEVMTLERRRLKLMTQPMPHFIVKP